jgi:hypothetical protein
MSGARTSGFPVIKRYVVTDAGGEYPLPGKTVALLIRNTDVSGDALRVYFNAADFAAEENFDQIANGTSVEYPAQVRRVWLRAAANTVDAAVVIAFVREGW